MIVVTIRFFVLLVCVFHFFAFVAIYRAGFTYVLSILTISWIPKLLKLNNHT